MNLPAEAGQDAAGAAVEEHLGSVRIAPNVLATVAALSALSVPGVARLGDASSVGRLMGRDAPYPGVKVEVKAGRATIDLHLATRLGVNALEVGEQVQRLVSEAVPTMIGMPVDQVHVHIDDVE